MILIMMKGIFGIDLLTIGLPTNEVVVCCFGRPFGTLGIRPGGTE